MPKDAFLEKKGCTNPVDVCSASPIKNEEHVVRRNGLGYRRLERVELLQLDTLTATDLEHASDPGIAALAQRLRQAEDRPDRMPLRAEEQLKSRTKTAQLG